MNDLTTLVHAASTGDNQAFSDIVKQFKEMAYGYAYTLLGDFHLAEDAAQEAFIEAYYNLKNLENLSAFPGWFRRIVQFRCNRFLQRKQLAYVPIEHALSKPSFEPGPSELAERKELEEKILDAVNDLSQPLREVTTLFYINGYSHKDISDFLEIPVNTVKSRLNASRKQLKRSMYDMIRDTLDNNRLPDDFISKTIEGVKKIGYTIMPFDTENYVINISQGNHFSASLCTCMKTMGEDYGEKILKGPLAYRMDNLYMHLMAASGAAFRLLWNPRKWDYYNLHLIMSQEDPLAPFRNAIETTGHECKIIGNRNFIFESDPGRIFFNRYEGEDFFREKIIGSIKDNNRPVIAWGVVGPPECCVITGFDESGEVLIGWSYYQHSPFIKYPDMEFETSGYFRQRDWFKYTAGIILIGDKKAKPSADDMFFTILKQAVMLFRTEEVHGRKSGFAAYKAWTDDLLLDDEFPSEDLDVLRHRLNIHNDAISVLTDGSFNAQHFLEHAAEQKPQIAGNLQKAAENYYKMLFLLQQCIYIMGGSARSEYHMKRLALPAIRRDLIPVLLKIRDRNEEAIDCIEKVIKNF